MLTLSRGSKQVRSGNYSQRDFFIVLPALLFSAQSAGQLFSLAPEVTRAKAAAQSVFSLHDEKPTIMKECMSSPTNTTPDTVGLLSESTASASYGTFGVRGELEFRNVSLHYESRPTVPALNDVSFQIRPGENVAFVGRSGKRFSEDSKIMADFVVGAGKSSTIHLIERFFDPTSGQVYLDGQDIRQEPVRDHRARLALVVS